MSTDPAALLPLAGQLRSLFGSVGYTVDGVDALLGPVATASLGRGELVPALAAASGSSELDVLVRLFLLARDEPAGAAAFLPSSVLEPAGGGLVRAALDLRPHEDDWWIAADIARKHPPPADHVIGIGAASLTLLAATLRSPVDSALDLGTGGGIQALHLTRTARRVTATDSVPRAIAMSRLTFALSGLASESVDLRCGDLLEPVAGELFDLVVSNPPFVLAPPGPQALTYRDAIGGDDGGLERLLHETAGVLAPAGVAQVLTSWVVPPNGDWQERPAAMLPAGCDGLIVLREVLDPAEHVALWRDEDEPEPAATARGQSWLAHVTSLGAAGIAYGMIVLRRTDAAPRVRLLDLTSEAGPPSGARLEGWLARSAFLASHPAGIGDLRLRVADGIRLVEESVPTEEGWVAVERRVGLPDALPQTVGVDPVTTALLAGCDGQLPVRAVAELLATASGAPVDGVLRVATELFETGHLVVAP